MAQKSNEEKLIDAVNSVGDLANIIRDLTKAMKELTAAIAKSGAPPQNRR
jgi:hypothetical protein